MTEFNKKKKELKATLNIVRKKKKYVYLIDYKKFKKDVGSGSRILPRSVATLFREISYFWRFLSFKMSKKWFQGF